MPVRGRADLHSVAVRPTHQDMPPKRGRCRNGRFVTANYVFEIARVHAENLKVYGVDTIWAQLNRDGIRVARCTVARLMRDLGSAWCHARQTQAHHHHR
jgi:transposase InsO family protein